MQTFVERHTGNWREQFTGTMVDRERFDRSLVEEAIANGADCRFATTVRSVRHDGCLELGNGEAIKGRVLIAADGPRSRVGRTVGVPNRKLVAARQVTMPLIDRHRATDIFLSADYVGGYGWLFPRGDVANIGIGVLPTASAVLNELLQDLQQSLLSKGQVENRVVARSGGLIPVGGIVATSARLEGTVVVFCGDAAGLTNPITGAGINAAVHSGERAGEAAVAALAGDVRAQEDYDEDIREVFGVSLDRALRHRMAILDKYSTSNRPSPDDLRTAWIAYPEYWAA